jgi:hypothetical protein
MRVAEDNKKTESVADVIDLSRVSTLRKLLGLTSL